VDALMMCACCAKHFWHSTVVIRFVLFSIQFLIGIWVLPWQKRKNPLLGDKKHFFTEITQLHTLISAIDFQFLQCNRQNKLQNRPITYH